jgi:hypothetical protein
MIVGSSEDLPLFTFCYSCKAVKARRSIRSRILRIPHLPLAVVAFQRAPGLCNKRFLSAEVVLSPFVSASSSR